MTNIIKETIPLSFKTVLKNMHKGLFFLTAILFIFGTLNIVNTSSFEITNNGHIYSYFLKQCIFLVGFGGILSVFILIFSTNFYKNKIIGNIKVSHILYIIILALTIGCFFMPDVRGAKIRFYITNTFGFQPSEIAKVIIILSLSILMEEWSNKIKNKWKVNWFIELIKFILIGFLVPICVILQKDLGSASIILVISIVMFLKSEYPKKIKAWIVAGGITLVTLVLVLVLGFNIGLTPAQRSRLTNFFKPCDYYTTTGYQVCNAFIAINQGGISGLGLGNSKQKYNYLVEPHTDSVFAIIAEEGGIFKTTLVLISLFMVSYILHYMSSKISKGIGKYICFGTSWYIFIHLFLNLGGLLGIIPLTGVPLPFFSYGGTFAMCLACSLALAQRVWVEEKTKRIKI